MILRRELPENLVYARLLGQGIIAVVVDTLPSFLRIFLRINAAPRGTEICTKAPQTAAATAVKG
nr:MAG TPA: hypothetical protein [Caudoviricetes sp.]